MNADNGNNTNNTQEEQKMSLETPTTSQSTPTYPSTPDSPRREDAKKELDSGLDLDLPEFNEDDISMIPLYPDSVEDAMLLDTPEEDIDSDSSLPIDIGLSDSDSDSDSPMSPILVRGPNGNLAAPASPTKVTQLKEWKPIPQPREEEEQDPVLQEEDEAWEQGQVRDFQTPEQEQQKHRWWKMTIFPPLISREIDNRMLCYYVSECKKYMQALLELANIICCIMGMEICPKTGRFHAHLLLGFSDAVRYSTIKNILRFAQLRFLEGDAAILRWYQYVIKAFSKIDHPDRIMQYGAGEIMKKKNRLNRTIKRTHRDLFYDNKQAIEEGRFEDVDPLFRFDHMSKIQKWYIEQHKAAIRVDHDRLVFIWGNPGVGKTSLFSRNIDPDRIYWKNPANRWWCGYRDQPIVIIDEITPLQFQSGNINWNIIGDRNDVYLEVKGSQVPLQAKWVIVISNYSLDQLCSRPKKGLDDLMKRTFKRRCGNPHDGYRIYNFPDNPPADNGDPRDVSRRVKRIMKVWYFDIFPYFNNLMFYPPLDENDE